MHVLDRRNTPARAGKTKTSLIAATTLEKHPRPCGEDSRSMYMTSAVLETPPPVRGRLPPTARRTSILWKHPRPCGEDHPAARFHACPWETPPPVRGRLGITPLGLAGIGNTPARAGKTERRRYVQKRIRKHPRPCGEDRVHPRLRPYRMGNTPARAGKTTSSMLSATGLRETPPPVRGRLSPTKQSAYDQ